MSFPRVVVTDRAAYAAHKACSATENQKCDPDSAHCSYFQLSSTCARRSNESYIGPHVGSGEAWPSSPSQLVRGSTADNPRLSLARVTGLDSNRIRLTIFATLTDRRVGSLMSLFQRQPSGLAFNSSGCIVKKARRRHCGVARWTFGLC